MATTTKTPTEQFLRGWKAGKKIQETNGLDAAFRYGEKRRSKLGVTDWINGFFAALTPTEES